jgi:hypothetical protein
VRAVRVAAILTGIVGLALAIVTGTSAIAADDPFALTEIPSTGRTVAAELADLDGDGRTDLLQVRFADLPPNERRELRAFFQQPDGSLPKAPDLIEPMVTGGAAYDVADVLPAPGTEVLLLTRDGVAVGSFAGRSLAWSTVKVPDGITVGAAVDERGLDRLAITTTAFGDRPVLVVPGIGEAFLLEPDGTVRGTLDVGTRANYFVQPGALLYAESDIQMFLDAPRLSIGDVDGDGRADVLSSSRHELRVFQQGPDGRFPRRPSRVLPLGRIDLDDHMRGSGSVRAAGRDIDADGRMDLLLSETHGGVMDAASTTSIYFNDGGGWRLDRPDVELREQKAMSADALVDLDGDRRLELVHASVALSVLELVEFFLTRAVDVDVVAYAMPRPTGATPVRDPDRRFTRKLDLPVSFDTSRLEGFIPTFEHDVNGDGVRDFLDSHGGEKLEVLLGSRGGGYDSAANQKLDTEGVLHAGDLNGDGLVDLVLCNPRRTNKPIRVLVNRGTLPGAAATPSAQPTQ